eukprot:UC4_evm1s593
MPPSSKLVATVNVVSKSSTAVEDALRHQVKVNSLNRNCNSFFVVDLADVHQKLIDWHKLLPRVEPHYAVKCNGDPCVLKALESLGTGFDCASQAEIKTMINMG